MEIDEDMKELLGLFNQAMEKGPAEARIAMQAAVAVFNERGAFKRQQRIDARYRK